MVFLFGPNEVEKEFVSTKSTNEGIREFSEQGFRKGDDDSVPFNMSIVVVDAFKVVDIKHHADAFAVVLYEGVDFHNDGLVIKKAGERVLLRLFGGLKSLMHDRVLV